MKDTRYCEDADTFNAPKAELAIAHSKTEHPFTTTFCKSCDEEICAACMVDVVRIHNSDINIGGRCPFCGCENVYLC